MLLSPMPKMQIAVSPAVTGVSVMLIDVEPLSAATHDAPKSNGLPLGTPYATSVRAVPDSEEVNVGVIVFDVVRAITPAAVAHPEVTAVVFCARAE
jgi:hypothetical protein